MVFVSHLCFLKSWALPFPIYTWLYHDHDHYRYSYFYLQVTSVYSGDSDAAHSDMEDSWMSQILWNSLFCGRDFFSWKYHSVTFHDEGLAMRVVCWSCQVQKQSGKICFVMQSLIYHNFPFPHSRLLFCPKHSLKSNTTK